MLNEKQMYHKIVTEPLVQDTQPPAACSFATKAVSVAQNAVEMASVLQSRCLHSSSFPDFLLCNLLSLLSSPGPIYPFIKKSFRVHRSKLVYSGVLAISAQQ